MNEKFRLNYPLREGGIKQTLALGVILAISPITFLPIIYYMGYISEVIKRTLAGKETPPKITTSNIIDYFKKGVVPTVIVLIYSLPLIIYGLIFFISAALGMGAAGHTSRTEAIVFIGIFGSITLATLHVIFSLTILPISLSIYSSTNSYLKPFSPKRIFNIGYSKEYLTQLTIGCIILVSGSFLAGIMSILIGLFLLLFPLLSVASFSIYILISPILILSIHTISIGVKESKDVKELV